jgi:hypothetical protein
MEGPISSKAAEPVPEEPELDARINKLVEQKRPSQIEADAERIRSSVVRLTSNSIKGLEGLSSEFQELQRFLTSEAERVQGDIDSALARIKIIINTIAPLQGTLTLLDSEPEPEFAGVRPVRAGPAANRQAAQSRH